jgi:undecaprenyl diphosphate synthase
MTLKEKINHSKLPVHIAVIMDGNGRWAKKKGNKRIFGHTNAVAAVKETIESCAEIGIRFLTLYAFSTENWNRPKEEVEALMSLLVNTIKNEKENLKKNNIRLLTIGDIEKLPAKVNQSLQEVIQYTSSGTRLTLILALSYSGRWDIINAVKQIAVKIADKKLQPEKIDEHLLEKYLQASSFPEPELLIRTSGEYRISNFLLWQCAYTELYFTDVLWPDFRKEHLQEAIIDYQKRERRFGKTSEQLIKTE